MRGGLVAGFGPGAGDRLDAVAHGLRWHGGAPAAWDHGLLHVRALVDPSTGPTLRRGGGAVRIVHGTAGPEGPTRFVVLESDGRTLSARRDALGLAPLFWRVVGATVWLATEVGPLRELAPAAPDSEALVAQAAGMPPADRTGWRGIFRLLPGATLRVDHRGAVSMVPWWRPERGFASFAGSREEAVDELSRRFRRAVERCLDGRTGVLLSGGLDSSSVACTAARCGAPPALVHVCVPNDPSSDERAFVADAAVAAGAQLWCLPADTRPWSPAEEAATSDLPPLGFPVGIVEVALRHLQQRGIGVALDGHDSDVALGRHGGMFGLLLLRGRLGTVTALARAHGAGAVARWSASELVPPPLRLRSLRRRPSLAPSAIDCFAPSIGRAMRAQERWRFPLSRWRHEELAGVTPPRTLAFEELESLGARFGVDLRHPLADSDLVRFLVSLPFDVKIDPLRSKYLLRDGVDGLPSSIRERRDKVFFDEALRRRASPAACLTFVEESGVRLPGVVYERLFGRDALEPDEVGVHACVRLARAHAFAATA